MGSSAFGLRGVVMGKRVVGKGSGKAQKVGGGVDTPISKGERPHPNGPRTPVGDPGSGAPGVEVAPKAKKPMKPSACRSYMRKELATHFEAIVEGFVTGAKAGNCGHVKLATEFLEEKVVVKKSRKKGVAERLLEELSGKKAVRNLSLERARRGDGRFGPVGENVAVSTEGIPHGLKPALSRGHETQG